MRKDPGDRIRLPRATDLGAQRLVALDPAAPEPTCEMMFQGVMRTRSEWPVTEQISGSLARAPSTDAPVFPP